MKNIIIKKKKKKLIIRMLLIKKNIISINDEPRIIKLNFIN